MFKAVVNLDPQGAKQEQLDLALVQWFEILPVRPDETGLAKYYLSDNYNVVHLSDVVFLAPLQPGFHIPPYHPEQPFFYLCDCGTG